MSTQRELNPFLFSDDNKRYHTLYYHLKHTFGKRMVKAVIDAGFTCPNIDGSKGSGGCTYCVSGAAEFTLSSSYSVKYQLEKERQRILKKFDDAGIIAYFQSHTNTYKDIDFLKGIYEEAISQPFVEGISIATRADCLDDEKISYLSNLSKKTYLTVELGLQTIFDETAEKINRCHSFDEFLVSYKKLKENGIRTAVHIINGLPGENYEMMLETAKVVGKLKPDALKIHLLHIMEGTKIAKQFENAEFDALTYDEYIKIVCNQLSYIPVETVIERITGDGSKDKLIAPLWSKNKIAVLGGIDKYLFENNLYQGINVKVL